jgi:hypothetical protein
LKTDFKNKTLFPEGWFSIGNGDPWNAFGTYGFIPFKFVPHLNTKLFTGDFQWLTEPDNKLEKFVMMEDSGVTFSSVVDSAKSLGIVLPKAFLIFFDSPFYQNCIISSTDCYFDLSDKVIAYPGNESGYFIRFMNDGQSVMHWYLYIDKENKHKVAACKWKLDSNLPFGISLERKLEDVIICSNSFEEFIYRFWIENRIWISNVFKLLKSEEEEEYLKEVLKMIKKYSDNSKH